MIIPEIPVKLDALFRDVVTLKARPILKAVTGCLFLRDALRNPSLLRGAKRKSWRAGAAKRATARLWATASYPTIYTTLFAVVDLKAANT